MKSVLIESLHERFGFVMDLERIIVVEHQGISGCWMFKIAIGEMEICVVSSWTPFFPITGECLRFLKCLTVVDKTLRITLLNSRKKLRVQMVVPREEDLAEVIHRCASRLDFVLYQIQLENERLDVTERR